MAEIRSFGIYRIRILLLITYPKALDHDQKPDQLNAIKAAG